MLSSSQTTQEVGVSRIHPPVSTSIKAAGVVTDPATAFGALPPVLENVHVVRNYRPRERE